MFLVVLVVVGICAGHALYRGHELLANLPHLLIVVLLAVTMAGLARWLTSQSLAAGDRAAAIGGDDRRDRLPREMAIVCSVALACLVVLFTGQDVGTLLVLVGVCATAVLQLTPHSQPHQADPRLRGGGSGGVLVDDVAGSGRRHDFAAAFVAGRAVGWPPARWPPAS